jgi:hypothetical protein
MEQNNRILLLIMGISVVLYMFLTLQFFLGIIAAAIIIIVLMVLPQA